MKFAYPKWKFVVSALMAATLLCAFTLPAYAAPAAAAPSLSTLAAQFEVKADKYYNSVRYSTNRYKHTESDVRMLAIVIYREARGQPYKAKIAVGNVVMNRVLSSGYPGKTVKEVVTRPNQFSYSAVTKPDAACVAAARDVLEREVWTVPQNTYFFRATSSKSDWGRHDYWAHVGSQAFYRDAAYKGRYNGSSIPEALYKRVYRWPQYGCVPSARVRKIQRMLISFGYDLVADGYFGQDTKDAVIRFQKSKGLKADGIAGPVTLKAMIKKYGISKFSKL